MCSTQFFCALHVWRHQEITGRSAILSLRVQTVYTLTLRVSANQRSICTCIIASDHTILANHLHSAIAIFGNMSSSMVGFLSSFFLLQISSTNVTPVTQESWVRITTKHTLVLWTPFFIVLALLLRAATLDPTMLPAINIQIVYLTLYHEGKSRHGMVKCAAYHYTIAHCVCAVTWYDEVSGSSFCRTSLLLGCQHHF